MAVTESSFDIISKPDPQEIKNAVQQAQREIETRFDFRNSMSEIAHDGKNELTLSADDEARMTALIDVLQSKLIKRGVDIRFLDYSKLESATKGTVRQTVTVKSGLPTETAKKIVKLIKDKGIKVNAQIQDEQVRVTAKSKDDLQAVQVMLKGADLDVPLQYAQLPVTPLNPIKVVGGVLVLLGVVFRAISLAVFALRAKALPDTPQARKRHETSKRNALLIDAAFVVAGFYVILRG